MIKLKSINKTYQTKDSPKVEALKDITLEFPSNGLITILGASGSGKTTLMNILGGLDIPTLGEIKIFDNDIIIQNNKKETLKRIEEYKRNYVSFIFQDYNLMPELNIGEIYKFSNGNSI